MGRWRPADHDDVDWPRVTRLTFVPFLEELGDVVIPDGGLPSGDLQPGEDPLLDAALRIPLEQAGFRRQGTHVFAMSDDDTHVAIWIEGHRYSGKRSHRSDAKWWTGDASEVDDDLVQLAVKARNSMSREQHLLDARRILDPLYLRAETPQGGSGFTGSLEDWTESHRHIAEAMDRDGTFLDVGCANGFLMQCMVDWCAARGVRVEPYGVDISPALVARAKERLPQWAERIWVGDAASWFAPRTFDVVHALLDVAETGGLDRRDYIEHVGTFVTPGGRLVLSHYGPTITAREVVEQLGYPIDGGFGLGVWLRR